MDNKVIFDKLNVTINYVTSVEDEIKRTIAEIVKDKGGLIKTIPTDGYPRLTATFVEERGEGEVLTTQTIFGVRCEEDGSITLCTTANVSDYEYDNGGNLFSSDYYFDEEETAELEKCLDDECYFTPLGDYDMLENLTLRSILFGLEGYIK